MTQQSIQIKKLLTNPDDMLAPNTWGDTNPCFFTEWACSDKSLRKKVLAILPRLQFLVDEHLINESDYVTFKNLQSVSVNFTQAIIIRKTKDGEQVLGGWCFAKKTPTRNIASYWSGIDLQGADLPDRYTGYGSWAMLKKSLKQDHRTRLAAKEIFMPA